MTSQASKFLGRGRGVAPQPYTRGNYSNLPRGGDTYRGGRGRGDAYRGRGAPRGEYSTHRDRELQRERLRDLDIVTRYTQRYNRSSDKIPDDFILNKKVEDGIELELRVGKFVEGKFVPGISKYSFDLTLHTHGRAFQKEVSKVTIYGDYRKIEVEGKETVYEIKKTINTQDFTYLFPYRASEKSEMKISQSDFERFTRNFKPQDVLIRHRERYSITNLNNGVRMDLTKVTTSRGDDSTVGNNITYELEFEKIADTETPIFDFIQKEYMSNYYPSHIFQAIIDAYDLKSTQPVDLGSNMKGKGCDKFAEFWTTLSNYAVTIKLDGIRGYLLISREIMPTLPKIDNKNAYKVYFYEARQKSEGVFVGHIWFDSHHFGTYTEIIFECEYYEDDQEKGIFVFDRLTGGDDNLEKRIEFCNEHIKDVNFPNLTVKTKNFFFGNDRGTDGEPMGIYGAINRCLDDNIDHIVPIRGGGVHIRNTDGLIFQHIGPYTPPVDEKAAYKWKPPNMLTIDFYYNDFQLYAAGKNSRGEYGNFIPFPSKDMNVTINLEELESKGLRDVIVELGFERHPDRPDFYRAKYHRIRNDKTLANKFDTVVLPIWCLIQDPITENTIRGNDLELMRKYHNNEKREMLEQYASGTILDIGSGQGGDLMKWNNNPNIQKIYAIEPDQEKIKIFKERLSKLKFGKNIQLGEFGAEDLENVDKLIDEDSIDTIVSFFSLTFFFENEEKFQKLLELVQKANRFMGICLDLHRETLDGELSSTFYNSKEKVWSIQGKGDNRIHTNLYGTFVEGVDEFIVDFEKLKTELKKKGYNLSYSTFLHNRNLPLPSLEYSTLQHAFVFERNTINPSVRKSSPKKKSDTPKSDTPKPRYNLVEGEDSEGELSFHSSDFDFASEKSEIEEGEGSDNGSERYAGEAREEDTEFVPRAQEDYDKQELPPLEYPILNENVLIRYVGDSQDSGEQHLYYKGVTIDRRNILHAAIKTRETTIEKRAFDRGLEPIEYLHNEILRHATFDSFLEYSNGALAGGYQARIFKKYGVDISAIENNNDLLTADIARKLNIRTNKDLDDFINKVTSEAYDLFKENLELGFLGEKSCYEVLNSYFEEKLKTTIVLCDERKSQLETTQLVKRVVCEKIIQNARMNNNIKYIVILMSFDAMTYFPVGVLSDEDSATLNYAFQKDDEFIDSLSSIKEKKSADQLDEGFRLANKVVIKAAKGKYAHYRGTTASFFGKYLVVDRDRKRIPVGETYGEPDAILYEDLEFVNPDLRKKKDTPSEQAKRFIKNVKNGKYAFPLKKNFYDNLYIRNMFRNLERYVALERVVFQPYTLKKVKGIETLFSNIITNPQGDSFIQRYPMIIRSEESDYEAFNLLSDMFNEEVRMKCRRKNSESPWDTFHKSPENVAEFILDNKLSFDNPRHVRDALWKVSNECTTFRPNILSTLIDMFGSTSVLDFSAGWGDRLISAMASKVRYTGIDPNTSLHAGYRAMIKQFANDRKGEYTMIESTIEQADIPSMGYNLVFTSPPYFDLELYTSGDLEHDKETQSSRYGAEDAWFEKFLKVALTKCWEELVFSEKKMNRIDNKWVWRGEWRKSIMAINLNQTSPHDRYVQKMIDFVSNKLGGYYLGVISYVNERDFTNPQPIWIWQKFNPQDFAEINQLRLNVINVDPVHRQEAPFSPAHRSPVVPQPPQTQGNQKQKTPPRTNNTNTNSQLQGKTIYIGKIEDADSIKVLAEKQGLKVVKSWDDADYIFKARFEGIDDTMFSKKGGLRTAGAQHKLFTVNCFPDHDLLTNKEKLELSLIKWCKENNINHDDIAPKTFLLDTALLKHEEDYDDFVSMVEDQIGATVIIKPTDSFGGNNIQVVPIGEFRNALSRLEKGKKYIVQQYLSNVMTVNNLDKKKGRSKFDLRVNIAMTHLGEMYQHNKISMRVSDSTYNVRDFKDQLAHITNLDLRDSQTANSQRWLDEEIAKKHIDESVMWNVENFLAQYVRPLLLEIIYKKYRKYDTPIKKFDEFFDIEKNSQFAYKNMKCFQRFGIDLIVLDDGTVKLLEINTNPGNTRENKDLLNLAFIASYIQPDDSSKNTFTFFDNPFDLSDPSDDIIENMKSGLKKQKDKKLLKFYINPSLHDTNVLMLMYYHYAKGFAASQSKSSCNFELVNRYEDANVIWNYRFKDSIIKNRKSIDLDKGEKVDLDNILYFDKFPEAQSLTIKSNLPAAFEKAGLDKSKFIPITEIIDSPKEYMKFIETLKSQKGDTFIVKPANGYGGQGIEVLSRSNLSKYTQIDKISKTNQVVVQEYIKNPLLLDGKYKFDMRVLVTLNASASTLFSMHQAIMVRIADKEYSLGDLSKDSHITNIADREISNKTIRHLSDCTKSLSRFTPEMIEQKVREFVIDLKPLFEENVLLPFIKKEALKGVLCHQTFGLDLLVTEDGDIKLLEVNGSPGRNGTDSKARVKFSITTDQAHSCLTDNLNTSIINLSTSRENIEKISRKVSPKKEITLETEGIKNMTAFFKWIKENKNSEKYDTIYQLGIKKGWVGNRQ